MSDITALLREQTESAPAYVLDVDRLVTTARRGHRRRVALTATTAVATLAVTAGSVVALTRDDAAGRERSTVLPATPAATAAPAPRDDDPVTADNIAQIVATTLGVTLADPHEVLEHRPGTPRVLSFFGNVDTGDGAGLSALTVTIEEPGMLMFPPPSCAERQPSTPDGDGYAGPCVSMPLPARWGGAWLVYRSGRTATGGFTKSHAEVIRPDGSGVIAESANQAYVGPAVVYRPHDAPKERPVTRPLPAVTAEQLRDLVMELALRGRD